MTFTTLYMTAEHNGERYLGSDYRNGIRMRNTCVAAFNLHHLADEAAAEITGATVVSHPGVKNAYAVKFAKREKKCSVNMVDERTGITTQWDEVKGESKAVAQDIFALTREDEEQMEYSCGRGMESEFIVKARGVVTARIFVTPI